MADLTAKFSMVDEMSDRLAGLAESGQVMLGQWSQAGETANAAFDGLAEAVTATATTADGIATSLSGLQEASSGASASADSLSDTLSNYGTAAEEAASQTDYWTDSVGNYNKSMLEAIYSTEELVEMGYKSAAVLEEEQEMFALCEQSADYLNKALEGSEQIQKSLNETMSQASAALSELTDNENVSAEAKAELERNSAVAAEAMQELVTAQAEAAATMENYDNVLASGTTDLSELEAAAERAYHAADNLAEANGKASEATEELSKNTQEVSEQADKAEESGQNAVEGIAGALAAAGITAMVKEIGEAAYELADAFSEAESTVVLATGATGEALDGLSTSMMNAYAASKTGTLDETASAVGEINTRLAYTGDMLEETTGQFLDFAAITGGDATAAVRSVTQLMNQWNVPASDMETMLSKLAYAGQASGISVDSLSQQLTNNKAILDQLGFTLDEATAMFMKFELAGTNGTSIMTGFRTALSKGEISSLKELNKVFDQIASGAMDAAQASELFGGRAGPAIVNAVQGGVLSLDEMVSALEAADGTLATTADAAQTLDQKWSQATGNISAAFTTALEPVVSAVSGGLAEMVNGVGDFLNEHQGLTKSIVALGTGLGVVATVLGVVAAGISGVTFATNVAIPAITSFAAAVNGALGPIGWIAIGITAATAAVGSFLAMSQDAGDETDKLTVSSQNMAKELDGLNAEYEETCRQFGENSAEAVLLRGEIDNLSQSYEESKMTVEDFYSSLQKQLDSHEETVSSYTETRDLMSDQSEQTNNLVGKLRELSEQTDVTTASQQQMESIIGKLQEMYPGLGISIKDVNGNLDKMERKINKVAKASNTQTKYENAQKTYSELVAEQESLLEKRDELQDIYNRACEQFLEAGLIQESLWSITGGGAAGAMDEAEANLKAANEALDENIRLQEECSATMEEYADKVNGRSKETVTAEDAVSVAIGKTSDSLEELATEYAETYQSALDSIEGQYSLWEKIGKKVLTAKTSVNDFGAALGSQIDFWDRYSENLDKLQGRDIKGLDKVLASMNDGSEESAAALAGLAGASDAELEKIVKKFQKLQSVQKKTATDITEISTGYEAELAKVQESMESTVGKMALEGEASSAAEKTIQSYINKIRSMRGSVSDAADYVAKAAAKALAATPSVPKEGGSTTTATTVPANANGTTNAANMFIAGEAGPELIVSKAAAYATGTTNSDEFYIAGENGPELIIGQQGSTVFPTEETDRIIKSLGNREQEPLNVRMEGLDDSRAGTEEQVKRILLEIAGSGAIEVGGKNGADKESILEVLTEHAKPVFLSILQQEIYEEGDLNYEF